MINILLMSDTGISPQMLACIDPDMFWDLQSAAVLDLALSLLKNP
ncbi:hypothetical protein [Morganella morganii]